MPPPPLEVEEVTAPERLAALRPEWLALWAGVPDATPFQSPAWLLPWWRHLGRGDLLTLAVRAGGGGGELVGLAPLFVRREPRGGRELLAVGVGVTDYLDPLLAPAHADAAAAAILAHLASRAGAFDRCDLECLRPGSPLLRAPAPPGWSDEVGERDPSPVLALPRRPEDLAGSVPRARLGRLPNYRRRAERMGAGPVEAAATPADAQRLLSALFALHAARWAGRGQPGVLADPAVQAFHREAAPELLGLGLLRLHGLAMAGRAVAVLYGLADRRRFLFYLGGFDPDVPHPGLGTLMIGHAVEGAVREGLEEFDFLRGREGYKYTWGAVDRPARARHLRPPPPPPPA